MLNQNESLTEKFVKKGFWLYLFSFIIWPLGYAIKVTLSWDLSVEEIGIIYGCISLLTLLSGYNDFGLTESLNYFLPKLVVKNDYGRFKYLVLLTILTQLITSSILWLGFYFGAEYLGEHYFKNEIAGEVVKILSLYFIGYNIFHINSTIFNVAQNTKFLKWTELLRTLSTFIGISILFFSDQGSIIPYTWIWIGWMGIWLIAANILWYQYYYKPYLRGVPIERDLKLRKQFYKYSLGTLLTANIGLVLSQIDMQLVLYFLGSKDGGFYSNYLSLIGIPFLILGPIIGFLFPVFSELFGRNDTEKISTIYKTVSRIFIICSIWVSVLFLFYGEILAVSFFGEKFRESGYILMFSSPFLIFNFLSQIHFQIMAGNGKIRERAIIMAIILPINVILNLIMILLLDLWSAGSALAVGLSWIPLYYLSAKRLGIPRLPLINGAFIKNLFGSFLCIGLVYIILSFIGNCSSFFQNIWNNCSLNNLFVLFLAFSIAFIIFFAINRKEIFNGFSLVRSIKK